MLTPKYKVGDTVWMVGYTSRHHKCPTCKQVVYDKGQDTVIRSAQITGCNVFEGRDSSGINYVFDSQDAFSNMDERYLYATKQEAQLKVKGKKR